ncbi:MAG TPA: ATP-binding cassette domain-containing protein [Actinomycetota bacterium]|jgi:NitT/TauT family transport system ATP-binding protein|nr:ATP-binding cassette domain-containing protein [Actinomycetota bacterium]
MTSLVLELQGIGKRFADGHVALDGVDLEVRPGELVSVLGPAGCGKSTLLRIVAGLTGPTSGMVTLGTRRVGLVFSDPALLPWRGMLASLDRPPRLRPELFLLDEPFDVVDDLSRHRHNEELARLHLERGFAALLATRSVTEAVLLSSRVVVLSPRPGRVVRELAVPLPYPRSPRHLSGAVSRLAAEVAGCLHAGGQVPAPTPAGAGAAHLPAAGPAPATASTPNP